MVTSRLAVVAALATGVDAARINRKRGADCYSPYDGKALLTLNACSSVQETLAQLKEANCYILDEPRVEQLGCTDAEVVCSDKVDWLEKAGVAKIVSSDAGAFWRGESGVAQAFVDGPGMASDSFYSDWRDLDAQFARVQSAVQASGGSATLESAGKTFQGRDMHIVRFRGRGYSHGGKRVFVTFNLHAREWITGMAGVYTVEQLAAKVRQDPDYLEGTEVVVMPMANPDGFLHSVTTNRMHRKNMQNASSSRCLGVDLNRNFDAHWGQGGSSSNPCVDTFMGPSAMSEPESNVVAGVMKEAPMTVYIDVHSFSELILTSPAWTSARSARHTEYRQIGRTIQQAIQKPHGVAYTEGPVSEVLYTATGGTIDYADDRGALGVCLELRPKNPLGGAFAPPKKAILPTAEETYAGILSAIDYAKNPVAPPAPAPTPKPWFFR